MSLYNDLKRISVTNKSDIVEPERVIKKISDGTYEVVLTRGIKYAIWASGGIRKTNFTNSISYFSKADAAGETATLLSIRLALKQKPTLLFGLRMKNQPII